MAKLNELKDKEALARLADMIEPVAAILTNPKVKEAAKKSKLHMVQTALKECGDDVMKFLALVEGVPIEEYHCTAASAINSLMSIVNNPDVEAVFTAAEQTTEM